MFSFFYGYITLSVEGINACNYFHILLYNILEVRNKKYCIITVLNYTVFYGLFGFLFFFRKTRINKELDS